MPKTAGTAEKNGDVQILSSADEASVTNGTRLVTTETYGLLPKIVMNQAHKPLSKMGCTAMGEPATSHPPMEGGQHNVV